jgi:hypothetical protein
MLAPGDRTRSIGAARGLQRVGMGILVMYLVMGRRERIRQKALGTAAGASAAVVVAIVAPASWALTVLAVVAMLLAVLLRATYGQLYGLYTFALVLYLATPHDVAFEAEERGLQILAGIALLIVGLAILHAVGQVLARRYPQPEHLVDAQQA